MFQTVDNTISSELVGTAAGNDTKTFETELIIPEVPSSHVDADGIGIFYSIQVKVNKKSFTISIIFSCEYFEVEADAVFGTVQESTSVIIGNIPHKSDYRAWATENMYEMREEIKVA